MSFLLSVSTSHNSFVAPNAYYEFQIDVFFITDIPKQKMKVGMMCVHIFYLHGCCPAYVKAASGHFSRTDGMYEKMGGKPKQNYFDDEGAYNNQSVIDFLKGEK